MAFSGSQVTRLGLYGGSRSPYGSFLGKTEQEITVSKAAFTGGWMVAYEKEVKKRKKKLKEAEELELKAQKIQNDLDREIALELQKTERERERLTELKRLAKLAQKHEADVVQLGERVEKAYNRAITNYNYSALEALERTLRQAKEDEDWLINLTMELLH